ncbi:DUF6644 family protein [Microbulbifer thermotolerans]|uniref:DUF6644 domain-containing protein n=1 Tax=Microbulbifer thermotolerans TaxID=252514 RepID=A0A143HJU0_MICTH|nr:DUF6644 family protein [Microbulbifer thermotolerans]AMX01923.1 hypothetical protein A3224_04385 [Microbulbifer thermotolerans]MCX2779169.1 hypothetical protein [Microbulbifer thermotolerans]MCX2803593.1 hypothetical protein [Microbulbifer thermotolerans]MCX2830356.1 hypothetical protein [Microbulbifer thermotolerans]MCX2835425.1 hypothetical protein [Microbulbifer thermotolerans]
MQDVINWMISSSTYDYINAHSWVWPTLESLHFIGLCLLFGSLIVVDLKIIGFAQETPFKAVDNFIFVTLIGLTINIATGIFFLFGDPSRYFINPSFKIKISLIFFAIINALYLSLRLRSIKRGNNQSNVIYFPIDVKIVAGLSLLLWTGVMIFGRLIPYME